MVLQRGKRLGGGSRLHDVPAQALGTRDLGGHVPHGTAGGVNTTGLDHAAHKLHALANLLQVELVFVQGEVQVLLEPHGGLLAQVQDKLLVMAHHDSVIDKTHITGTNMGAFLEHEAIKVREIEIGEQLARDVADGHAHIGRHVEQALPGGQGFPQALTRAALAQQLGLVADGDLGEPQQGVKVITLVVLAEPGQEQTQEHILVYRHEEAADVYLAHPRLAGVTLAHALDVSLGGLDGAESAVAFSTVERYIALATEPPLEQRFQPERYPVLHNAVTERGSEYLAQLGPRHNEAERLAGHVGALMHLKHQPPKVSLELYAVLVALLRCQLVPDTVKIGIYPPRFLFITKCDHRSHTVGIVLIVVVVDGAAPCINVVRVGSAER